MSDLTGNSRYDMFSYQGRRVALGLIYLARELADQHPGGTAWLRAIAREAGDYLEREEWLTGRSAQQAEDPACGTRKCQDRNDPEFLSGYGSVIGVGPVAGDGLGLSECPCAIRSSASGS